MDAAIPIYHLDTHSLKVDIQLSFEGENLVLDGYDLGASVRELTGDSD